LRAANQPEKNTEDGRTGAREGGRKKERKEGRKERDEERGHARFILLMPGRDGGTEGGRREERGHIIFNFLMPGRYPPPRHTCFFFAGKGRLHKETCWEGGRWCGGGGGGLRRNDKTKDETWKANREGNKRGSRE
jgi:hypothetical protein